MFIPFFPPLQLINLLPSSSEYIKVQTNFQRTLPRVTISAIKRIQNASLWEVYQWYVQTGSTVVIGFSEIDFFQKLCVSVA